MWACLGGHAAVVTKLVALGSNIGVKDKEERLGLHWAAEKGHADAVGVLVRHMLQANLDIQATVRKSGFSRKKGQKNHRKGQKRKAKKRQERKSKQRKGQNRREEKRQGKKAKIGKTRKEKTTFFGVDEAKPKG